MPRNGSGVYSKPAGTTAVPNTTIESAKYNATIDDIVDDLNAARPRTAGGTGETSVPAARQAFTTYTTKSAGYTAAKTDAGAIHRCSAEITVSLTAATTLGANWTLTIIADGGDVTIDADGTELINGEETLVVADGDAAYLICTGSGFKAITIPGVAGVAKLETANTFTKTQVWSKGADVASAAALTLGDDGNYFDVTGTTAITSIATVGVGTWIKLHFDGALTLTHHSTDLVLPGGANITTAAGDEAELVEYDTGKWRCTNYQRATPLKAVVQEAATFTGAVMTGTATIPGDDTIPQISEGTEFLTVSITPKDANNILEIEAQLIISVSAASQRTIALFQNGVANALRATQATPANVNFVIADTIKHRMVAGTTSAITFSVRAGASSSSTLTLNGTGGSRLAGGVLNSYIQVKEYTP